MAQLLLSRMFADARLNAQGGKLDALIAEIGNARARGNLPKAKQLLTDALSQWEKENRLARASQCEDADDPVTYQSSEGITLYIENAEVLNALGDTREACASMRQAQSLIEPLRYKLDPDYVSDDKYKHSVYASYSRDQVGSLSNEIVSSRRRCSHGYGTSIAS